MQERENALETAVPLRLVWAVWHVVPLLQVRRSPGWIAWWTLGTLMQFSIAVVMARYHPMARGLRNEWLSLPAGWRLGNITDVRSLLNLDRVSYFRETQAEICVLL
jgi:hypothetical protein